MSNPLSTSPLKDLEPQAIWSHFDGIRQVPRPSKHEEKIVAHVRGWATQHGFDVQSDAAGNMVISVPASTGHEDAPTVVLQAHLDMVCEKNEGVEHDFFEDPIGVRVEGDWVKTLGTTLGADNGLGAATAMAAAVDPEVVHGPLELLMTLDEETGLNGASALDGSMVSGKILLNLDTEEDDAVYIGCAGAGGMIAHVPLERQPASRGAIPHELAVHGLAGGHSGIEIGGKRANAIKVMTRLLMTLQGDGLELCLASLRGGSARNAIAREAFAVVYLDGKDKEAFEAALTPRVEEIQRDLDYEDDLSITLTPCHGPDPSEGPDPGSGQVLGDASRDRLLRVLAATPHGVLAMSAEVPGLVETSNNLALVGSTEDSARIICSYRSSSNPALGDMDRSLTSLYQLAGARVEEDASYPGWSPRPDSPVVQRTIAAYEAEFGESPGVKAVHAGLECGILAQKVPGLDAVSIGPEILGAHSPDERARISSVVKFYRLFKRLLADLAASPTN